MAEKDHKGKRFRPKMFRRKNTTRTKSRCRLGKKRSRRFLGKAGVWVAKSSKAAPSSYLGTKLMRQKTRHTASPAATTITRSLTKNRRWRCPISASAKRAKKMKRQGVCPCFPCRVDRKMNRGERRLTSSASSHPFAAAGPRQGCHQFSWGTRRRKDPKSGRECGAVLGRATPWAAEGRPTTPTESAFQATEGAVRTQRYPSPAPPSSHKCDARVKKDPGECERGMPLPRN
jgi:hypothetical protein